ncbi:MAG: EAL domain-containing protein [Geminicoccaceae bacterium]
MALEDVIDIRREAAQRRRAQRIGREPTFLEAVLQHLPAGVLIVEAFTGRIMFHNGQLEHGPGSPKPTAPGAISDRNSRHFRFNRALARAVARGELAGGKEVPFVHRDGTRGVAAVNTLPIHDATGQIIAQVAVFQDLTERKAAEERIRRLALHDPLTGLPNRVLLHDRLGQAMARARRDGVSVAVFALDLDRFKDTNDALGHAAGDRLLCDVAERISAEIRATDTLARLGGDEFALVQPQLRQVTDATALADKILATFAAPFMVEGHEIHAGTSIGIALFPQDGEDPRALLKNADVALYRAKADGRNSCRLYEPAMNEEARARRQLDLELRQALQHGEFVLHYQPQLELETGRFSGVEALIRWNHPQRGLVLPGEFIPAAEANGLIRPLGSWVLREACRQARLWRKLGLPLAVAVNLSPVQLRHGCLLPAVGEALADNDLEPEGLELEITEGAIMHSVEQHGGSYLRGLAATGVHLAIDDFGTGYSSFAYLKHLPVTTIKVDRSFIRDLGQDPQDEALVRGIVTLSQSLGKRVVAEGVENPVQLELLRQMGCNSAQGFHIAPPQEAARLETMLRA